MSGDVIALIPARGGSKRLPRKNVKVFRGKPLITWTIEAALRAQSIDGVCVSTEDEEIAEIASGVSAEVSVLRRPYDLATDEAAILDVERHFVEVFRPGVLVRLQPTSPLRRSTDIDGALAYLRDDPAVVSVHSATDHPWLVRGLDPAGYLLPPPAGFTWPSQRYPVAYRINGTVYAARVGYWQEHEGYFGPQTAVYVMERHRSIDIDDHYDWAIAEALAALV